LFWPCRLLQVGLVSQEPTLFATSIYENIAQGRPGALTPLLTAAAAVELVVHTAEYWADIAFSRALQLLHQQHH
jgi:ABC-type multidrug transport system fused ATPase/permease subunit